jgi:hypothetical protein
MKRKVEAWAWMKPQDQPPQVSCFATRAEAERNPPWMRMSAGYTLLRLVPYDPDEARVVRAALKFAAWFKRNDARSFAAKWERPMLAAVDALLKRRRGT